MCPQPPIQRPRMSRAALSSGCKPCALRTFPEAGESRRHPPQSTPACGILQHWVCQGED